MSMIGKSLVHYEITAQIGRGGMGEVYQAKDTKLGREVAIKVLPEEFAMDKDRVTRFQREAKLLASLNHPNIAAIYGLEESDGTHFLVMELIAGDTLRDRIKSGPIPVEEALKLSLQMAEALEAAHEKGVIHRDLKPANIKVTPDGKVKILDFGLAKAYVGDQENLSPMDSPTISAAATQQGVILGTAAYMSPEQARGKPVDRRADIWAFGVVLFEMLTGQTAFQGEDVSETLASVIKGDSNLALLPPNIHPRVREVITRCLQKDMRKRYSSIGDGRYEIEQALSDPNGVFVQPVKQVKPKKKLRVGIPWIAAAIVVAVIITGVVVWMLRPTEPRQVAHFYHELPQDQQFTRPGDQLTAVSADGTKIVYGANYQLYLRNLNGLTARPIQGTNEDPAHPFFSPDGQSIGYYSFSDGQWKKISVTGGASVKLCDASPPNGATWGSDGAILFAQRDGVIWSVSENGGTAEPLIEAEEGEQVYGPQALPGGEWVLFTFRPAGINNWDESQIVVQSLKTGERKVLVSGGSDGRYVPTGHIVYTLGDDLLAFAFDIENMEKLGGAVPIVEEVQRAAPSMTGASHYAISNTGMLAYLHIFGSIGIRQKVSLVWVDREGKEEQIEAQPDVYFNPRVSPDGTKVALEIGVSVGVNEDIWIRDLVRKTITRLTFVEAADDYNPIWTPDGQRIIFGSDREGRESIYWKAADGSGNVEQLASAPEIGIWPESISNDGNTLFWVGGRTDTERNIGMLPMEGDRTPKLLLQEEFIEDDPRISPDGRWLAYVSDESDQREVYVRPFPNVDSGGRWQVSTGIGGRPIWSPNGTELFYQSLDEIMAVSVETDPIFKLGIPKSIFPNKYVRQWDIHPDGERFLMMKESTGETSTEEASRPRINIVLNWFEELKQRVPVD